MPSSTLATSARRLSKDETRLAELGIKQELDREWSLIHNFGVSFSVISVITGITTLFQYGLTTGGPAVMSVGWIVVSFLTMFVALGMSEIVSSLPSAGGPYYWSAMLASRRYAPFAAWITGWFNLLGQVAVTTGITFGCAGLISNLATLRGYEITAARTLGIFAVLLFSHGVINTFGVRTLRYLNDVSIALHSLGIFSYAVAILAAAPTHRSASEVFAFFYDGTGVGGADGWSVRASPAYVAVVGILMSQYTITGFDASAHLSEETRNASVAAPIGVISSVAISSVFGFFLILALLFSIQDFDRTIGSDYGQPVLQILVDIFGVNGATAMMTLVILCVWHCGLFSVTSNSRMMFSFARDGGIPQFFHHVDAKWQSPIRTVWLAILLAFLLAVPSLGSAVAFAAATSIATIGLYISYTIPILIGLVYPAGFIRGPFTLGRFSRPVAAVACAYVAFLTIVFCLPQLNPVNKETLNYTPVAVGVIGLWCFASWFLWARRWFVGPLRQIEAEIAGVNTVDPSSTAVFEKSARLDHGRNGTAHLVGAVEHAHSEKSALAGVAEAGRHGA